MENIASLLWKEAGTFIPEMLNRGNHRVVWTMEDPALVLKLPRYNTRFDINSGMHKNLQEWLIWQVASPQLRKWLCQPMKLEYGGLAMIMERGDPITKMQVPQKVPSIIAKNDNTYPNWVKVGDLYKRCDYHTLYHPIMKKQIREKEKE